MSVATSGVPDIASLIRATKLLASKIRGEAVDLPIAVTHGIKPATALDFFERLAGSALAVGTAGGGFGQRTYGRRRHGLLHTVGGILGHPL